MPSDSEDVVKVLMETLVDPLLPTRLSIVPPSEDSQKSVAKQMHAVVLLYNYYHRKQELEQLFLDFMSFCKLAVAIRPPLTAFMKLMMENESTDLSCAENQLSLTEKAMKDACDIAATLDASKDVPYIKQWPISKVVVLLIDSKKENCMLHFGAITQGVWSTIEREITDYSINLEISAEAKLDDKKNRNNQKLSAYDHDKFLQLGYDAGKDIAGIDISELEVLETHVTYSLSKEKSAALFFMMQFSGSFSVRNQVPLKFLVDSLHGPLAEKLDYGYWRTTTVVEYYHMLPYVELISSCLSRKDLCLPSLSGCDAQSTMNDSEKGLTQSMTTASLVSECNGNDLDRLDENTSGMKVNPSDKIFTESFDGNNKSKHSLGGKSVSRIDFFSRKTTIDGKNSSNRILENIAKGSSSKYDLDDGSDPIDRDYELESSDEDFVVEEEDSPSDSGRGENRRKETSIDRASEKDVPDPDHSDSSSEKDDSSDNDFEIMSALDIVAEEDEQAQDNQGDGKEEEEDDPDDAQAEHLSSDSEFEISQSYSTKFYTQTCPKRWREISKHKLIEERRIKIEVYERYNLVQLLRRRKLLTTVSSSSVYVKEVVLEFYANLVQEMRDEKSRKYGKVFVRSKIYVFTPALINSHFGLDQVEDEVEFSDEEVVKVITGGRVLVWPSHPRKLAASQVTSLYSVLHKVGLVNWVPSLNNSVVTKEQGIVLFKIGTGIPFDFGHMVFQIITKFAGSKSQIVSFPFPSLIYSILGSQGFKKRSHEKLTSGPDPLTISHILLKGARVKDLPFVFPGEAPPAVFGSADEGVANALNDLSVLTIRSVLQDQVATAQRQIDFFTSIRDNALWKIKLLSGQKGREEISTKSQPLEKNQAGSSGTVHEEVDPAKPSVPEEEEPKEEVNSSQM